MGFLKRHASSFTYVMAVLDSTCIAASCILAAYLTLPADGSVGLFEQFVSYRFYLAVYILVWCMSALDQRLFSSQRGIGLLHQIGHIARAAVIALAITGLVTFFIGRREFTAADRQFLLYFGIGNVLLLIAFRVGLRMALYAIRRRGYNFRQILIVGANPRSRHLVEVIQRHGGYGYQFVGILEDEPRRLKDMEGLNLALLGSTSELENILSNQVVDEVFIGLPVRRFYQEILSMAHLCEGVGVPVRMIADLFPVRVATSRVRQMEDIPILSLSTIPEASMQLMIKRAVDLVVSSVFLVLVASWLFPVLAILLKLDSKGPVFFYQERVGLNQRRFKMIKFRSMVINAEELKESLAALNEADGPVFKMKRDPRMTRMGRWMRKFSMDELPQFWNVFVGDMSLVGPRPPVPKEVAKYTWDQRRRLSVRPGLTGLQQVSGRSDLNFEEWVELDLAYIDNWNILEDFRIIFRTFQVVLLAKGAA
ncbi:MAG: polyprenyl glycosylphosphotransferase [Candidatus Hydrogenedentota bacterium]